MKKELIAPWIVFLAIFLICSIFLILFFNGPNILSYFESKKMPTANPMTIWKSKEFILYVSDENTVFSEMMLDGIKFLFYVEFSGTPIDSEMSFYLYEDNSRGHTISPVVSFNCDYIEDDVFYAYVSYSDTDYFGNGQRYEVELTSYELNYSRITEIARVWQEQSIFIDQ